MSEINAAEGSTPGKYDLLLRGGHVIDPKNGISQSMDVAVADGRVAALGTAIPASAAQSTIDVSGCYVTPGLIDIHVHVYPPLPTVSIVADGQSFSSGITTMVDAGSTGAIDFGRFKETVIDQAKTRILAFLNIVDLGMDRILEQETSHMRPKVAAGLANTYPETIVGIKIAHYWTWEPWDQEHRPWTNVERGIEAGALCDKPIMVDWWPRPPDRTYKELILKHLRPGDIHTHYLAQQFPIVLGDGQVNPILFEARDRGVIFDVGHGAGSFWFRNAVPSVEQGFLPDSISTDLHTGNAANGLVTNVLNVMSKFLCMGVGLDDVIRLATSAPACEIGHPELGNLSVGAEADVAVFRLKHGRFGYIDCGRAGMIGDKKLECVLTLRNGAVAFDPEGISLPEWRDAPESYWVCRRPIGAPDDWMPPVH